MQSAIYEGLLTHRRFAERRHQFSHRLALAYVDLDEVEFLLGGRLTRSSPGLVRFRRRDYLGHESVPLVEAVRGLIAEELGTAPDGPIRVLTHMRSFGRCFNPVSFYYCYGESSNAPEVIVAEVTNTPWGERHAYVLDCRACTSGDETLVGVVDKRLHVSPFMGMDQEYVWHARAPGASLFVRFESIEKGERVFDAMLSLRRRPFDARTLAAMMLRYPLGSQRTVATIYAHALVLRAKGVRMHPYQRSA